MLTIILLTVLLAILIAYPLRKRSRLPPGPFPFPLIGNLPQIGTLSAKHGGIVGAMRELQKQYGPVFTLWMGPQPTVHIATMELAQETMIKRGGEFTQRWVPLLFNAVRKGLGIIGTSGDHWVEQRRFTLHTLRNFGLGRSIIEDRIMAEVDMRTGQIDKMLESGTTEMEPPSLFDHMVGSIINRMLFGEPLDGPQADEFLACKREIDRFTEELSVVDFFLQKDFLTKLPLLKQRWNSLVSPHIGLRIFLEKQVAQRLKEVESGDHVIPDEPEDYVDAFLLKMREEQKQGNSTSYSVDSLVVNLMDLWIAGQETTVTTIITGFAHLLNHADVVHKIREELLTVTRSERPLSLKDKSETPYYNAVITEIQRHASILNINLFRKAEKDTVIGGYPVEEGTPLTAELSLIMSDEKYFKDDEFNPSRFLSSDKLDQQVVPFGMGKRACLGESLARAELYLIIGNMLLRYDLQPTDVPPVTVQKNNTGVLKKSCHYTMSIKKLAV